MTKVEINLYATLRKHRSEEAPGKPLLVEVSDGTTLTGLLEQLGIPEEEIQVVFVNNMQRHLSYILQPGDKLGIFPPIAGG